MAIDKQQLLREHPDIKDFLDLKPTLWLNPGALANDQIWQHERFTIEDIEAANADLHRYAPLLEKVFPETIETHGIIESPLALADKMGQVLAEKENFSGHLLVKLDSELSVAGSIKARGGMYEVLKFAEKLALENGIIADKDDDYTKLARPPASFSASTRFRWARPGTSACRSGLRLRALASRQSSTCLRTRPSGRRTSYERRGPRSLNTLVTTTRQLPRDGRNPMLTRTVTSWTMKNPQPSS